MLYLRKQLLHYLRDGFVDGVIVDRGEEVAETSLNVEFSGNIPFIYDFLDISHNLDLLLLGPVHVSVYLMNENFNIDPGIKFEDLLDGVSAPLALLLDRLVCSDHIDHRTGFLNLLNMLFVLGVELVVARIVNDIELNPRVVVHL